MTHSFKFQNLSICLLIALSGCSTQTVNIINEKPELSKSILINRTLSGQVNFIPEKFKIKATQSDIATQATVSILYPNNYSNQALANSTIATGLTDSQGRFKINTDSTFLPVKDEIYILEARKRIGGEGKSVMSLKTFIKWTGKTWTSITGENVFINTKTTAAAIMSGYNAVLVKPSDTIEKMIVSGNTTTISNLTTVVSSQKVEQIALMVNQVLNDNKDPISEIKYITDSLIYNSVVIYYGPCETTCGGSGGGTPIFERTVFNGKVYDPNLVPVEGATVSARSIDAGIDWIGETQVTVGGAYVFRNAPVGARIAITVTKNGWTSRTRSEVLKTNLQGDPFANVFDFSGIYAIQDEPEVMVLKINGRVVSGSSNGDVFITNTPGNSKPTPARLDISSQIENVGNIPSLTGLNSNTIEVEMTFSEPIKVDDVRNYFRITSQSGLDNRSTSFTIDANYSGVDFIVSSDERSVTFRTNKAVLANRGGDEARYLVDFSQAFRDKSDKSAIFRRHFRFSPSQVNDFAVFSLKNDEEAPRLLGITARDGGSANDTIELRYSEPMELINQASFSSGLSDPAASSNLSRQLWYRDANQIMSNIASITGSTSDNNATLVGYLSNSDTDPNQFRASYMIGRILSSDVTAGTPKISLLGSINRIPKITPVKGNTTANDLLRNARITGSNVLLEFSPTAFDRDDRIVVTVAGRSHGSYVDRNRTPVVNEDLTVNTASGASVEYAQIFDPAGRLIDNGNSTTSANIDVDNAQRVATAS